VFQNWAKKCKIRDLDAEIIKTKQLTEHAAHVGNSNQDEHERAVQKLAATTDETNRESEQLSHKLGASIGVIIRLNDENYF